MIQRLLPALLVLAFAAAASLLPASARADDALVEGRHYRSLPDARPLQAEPGKVEVVEVFAYWCGHCNAFQPMLAAWRKKQPDDVAFRYLPAAFTLDDTGAHAFFAAESLGALDRTHDATYRAIHAEQSLRDRGASPEDYAGLYAGLGLDRDQVLAAMRSPETRARVAGAREFMVAAEVEGTPTIIVNGRYRVLGGSYEELLANTDRLVARERAALAGH